MEWKDVTLGQFNKIKKLNLKEMDGQIEAAEILLGIDGDKMSWSEFCKEVKKLDFLDQKIPEVIIKMKYTLNGRVYNCCPDITQLNVARYMDFTTMMKTGQFEKIIGVLLIEEGKEYGEDLDQVYADILTMSIVDVYAIFNFFKLEFKASLKTLKDYSVGKLKKDKELQKIVSAAMDSFYMLDL